MRHRVVTVALFATSISMAAVGQGSAPLPIGTSGKYSIAYESGGRAHFGYPLSSGPVETTVSFLTCEGEKLSFNKENIHSTPGDCKNRPGGGILGTIVFSTKPSGNGTFDVTIIDSGAKSNAVSVGKVYRYVPAEKLKNLNLSHQSNSVQFWAATNSGELSKGISSLEK